MKNATPFVFYYAQHVIGTGPYYSTVIERVDYTHFLFFVDILLGANAGQTTDVTLQVRIPGKDTIWYDYKDFAQVLQNTHICQTEKYEQLLGIFRFKIVQNQASVAGDKIVISGYMRED